ncbi:MAG: hypothetical protein KDE28_08965, partial [Anaerolineales bacterium]|nr:hypothetical protein [Anaerolineales bacterium]
RLGELVDEILRHSDEAVKMRNLNLTIEDLTGLPVIEGDGPQLRTALENVIGNAIKYTPDGGWI